MSQLQSLPLGQLLEKWKQITNCNDLRLTGNEEKMIEFIRNSRKLWKISMLTNSPETGEIIHQNEMSIHALNQGKRKDDWGDWMPAWRNSVGCRYRIFYINVRSNRKINNNLLLLIGCFHEGRNAYTIIYNFDPKFSAGNTTEESLSNDFNKLSVEESYVAWEMSDDDS